MTKIDVDWEDLQEPEYPRIHKCDGCGKEESWGKSWQWYGSYRDVDDGNIEKSCSEECRNKLAMLLHPTVQDTNKIYNKRRR